MTLTEDTAKQSSPDQGDAERPAYFQTTAAAARAGVSLATLRARELDGLVTPLRTATGVRLFTVADIDRARQDRHGRTGSRPAAPPALR
jgi:hypothetical protein